MKRLLAFAEKVQGVVTILLLSLAYIIGIGTVSVLGKLLRTSFLSHHRKQTSWVPFQTSNNEKVMY
ncbi:hypothetical protein KJZ67_00875 [Patescibacteria group bacterium]|nr:hypothetical protein [Patescibacteria group bacterium]